MSAVRQGDQSVPIFPSRNRNFLQRHVTRGWRVTGVDGVLRYRDDLELHSLLDISVKSTTGATPEWMKSL